MLILIKECYMTYRPGLVARVGMILFFGLVALGVLVAVPPLLVEIAAGIAAVALLFDK
jgi:hypothetical protein